VRRTSCLIIGLLALIAAAACNRDVPESDLDRFISQYETMPREQAIAELQDLAVQPGQTQAYARYQLGNMHYGAAADSARTRGWNDEFAQAALDSAQHWFEAAVAADSTFVEAYVNLGALWDDRADMMAVRREREERIATAKAMYERALELRPHDEKARCNLGSLYKRQGDFEQAMTEYLTALEHDPESALAHYNLAILFATQKIYREAITEFEAAVKHDPEGDIGDRSRDNIKIIEDLLASQAAEARKPS
jgi:tetratricopeptide (TPR) repeat protein